MLACYYVFPNRDNHEYTKDELMKPEVVEELFDYCQILEAYITKKGWAFLIEHYGYEKLYEIDKKSGWLDAGTLEEYISAVEYHMHTGSEQ